MKFPVLLLLLLPLTALADCRRQAPEPEPEPEPFSGFIARFAREKAFAQSRTVYPTYSLRHEYGYEDDKAVHATVRTDISQADDAVTPPMGLFARENGLRLGRARLSKDAATVRMEKPDTDWLLTWHFIRRGHCWYLHHIEDHSL